METNAARPQNMIDTTDALEAVSACQSMKNFLFTLILIGLILCQIVFWMDHFNLINKEGGAGCPTSVQKVCPQEACPKKACSQKVCPASVPQTDVQNTSLIPLAATTEPAPPTEPVAGETKEGKTIEETIDEIVRSANQEVSEEEGLPAGETDDAPAEALPETAADDSSESETTPQEATAEATPVETPLKPVFSFHISCSFAMVFVAVCNFVILSAVILYCLSLLVCLKISLAGRLGGINHITRAFFISLFLLVIVMPWQVILPKVLIGSSWLPGELLCGGWAKADGSTFWTVMLYLRFCGLCLVTFWLLLWAQLRSAKWARATLRRLGVAR